MSVGALREAMRADASRGMRPMAVIATLGTTSTASVDPLEDVASVCAEHGAWLHVDAAYGGAYAALPEGRWIMRGVEHADSFVVNPHKWLFVPLDFSALYLKRPHVLRSVFSLVPEYLRGDAGADHGPGVDYMDYGIQLGRRFRALKAWMAWRAMGRNGLVSRIREHCRLAALAAAWIEAEPSVRLAAPQMMGVVCFRFEPPGMTPDGADELNEAIVRAVLASGAAYVTHTKLRGRTCVRIGIGNALTTEEHVSNVWARIRHEAHGLAPTLI
jgi:aromatic-L-amino-acid/L-tryptophan decarboxylase